MCKELEERKSEQNINLGFRSFCRQTKIQNKRIFLKQVYQLIQTSLFLSCGCFLSEKTAKTMAREAYKKFHNQHFLDILNRQSEFVFY